MNNTRRKALLESIKNIELAYNTIEAEDEFDVRGNMNSGGDYIIVISK